MDKRGTAGKVAMSSSSRVRVVVYIPDRCFVPVEKPRNLNSEVNLPPGGSVQQRYAVIIDLAWSLATA